MEVPSSAPATDPVISVPAPAPHIIASNLQDLDPRLQMIEVPRRHNTHPGHGPTRRTERGVDDVSSRAIARITKKLADVSDSLVLFQYDLIRRADGFF